MDYKLLADTALLAGELMLQSGAETFRVEETITRILKTSGQERTEAIAYATGIMITLDGKDSGVISKVCCFSCYEQYCCEHSGTNS